MSDSFSVADLFCGGGGLSLGFKMAGYEINFGLDFDWDAIFTYTKNNPSAAWLNKDIRKVSIKEILEASQMKVGDFDVIVAGIPCEGYSLLNRRYDPSDPRNYLFLEFTRVVDGLKPKAVLIENVPGLARRANGSFRQAIENKLEKLGYKVVSFELNAENYGVPQRRVRLFFVGVKGKCFVPPSPLQGKLTVRDAISDLPSLEPGEEKKYYISGPKTDYQRLMRHGNTILHNHRAPNHPRWTVELIKKTEPGKPLYKTFKQRIRLSWDEPAPTIPAGGVRPQWFFAHPEQDRGLTVREMARLQSFPDNYIFYGSMIKQRVLVGDSVPPLLAKALAEKLKEYL